MPYARAPALTAALETITALRRREPSTILHYTADTGPLLATRGPSVVTVHGVASRWIETARRPAQERTWRGRVARAIAATDRIISVSESGARDVADVFGVERENITVIPHGVDVDRYSVRREVSPELAKRLPAEFLLYLGNIEPRKNLVELIRAVDGSADLPPLVIAGRPAWNFDGTMDAIKSSTRVHYLGFVGDEDAVALMQRCALFVFPSLYEGFGFPVVEALAAGAPVLTSDRGSLPEVSGPSYVIHDLDRAAIAAGIRDALADDNWLSDCRAGGLEWAKRFSWEESATRHVSVYEGLLR
ncbi:glycosyltransferase family 1 protein [Cellulomonas sp. PSBB021]|uniref:glycosyltransferase family 4 protein n=1 Tax=Cellulomonas sp. PSBB021 TaxID=2003551 RepID=UPI0018DF0FB0|nr:glycosyltransferase family 1 protein [Cellulomonas sp. PSBB021]